MRDRGAHVARARVSRSGSASEVEARRVIADVTDYYQRNTRRFLRFGGGGSAGAIHRQVWGPGVETEQEALLHVNTLLPAAITPALPATGDGHVLDLGCGVGGTALWLCRALDVRVTGVTLSSLQVDVARERAAAATLADRCRFLAQDFSDLRGVDPAHAAIAIESFAHAPSAAAFCASVARALVPGGRLVICDDFVAERAAQDPDSAKTLGAFRRGWRLHSLITHAELVEHARSAGLALVSRADLTPQLNLGRPRDRIIGALVGALGWVPGLTRAAYWGNLSGGSAAQVGLRRGWLCYELSVWEKT